MTSQFICPSHLHWKCTQHVFNYSFNHSTHSIYQGLCFISTYLMPPYLYRLPYFYRNKVPPFPILKLKNSLCPLVFEISFTPILKLKEMAPISDSFSKRYTISKPGDEALGKSDNSRWFISNTFSEIYLNLPSHTHTHTVRENYIIKTKRTTKYENENTKIGKGESQSRNMKYYSSLYTNTILIGTMLFIAWQ